MLLKNSPLYFIITVILFGCTKPLHETTIGIQLLGQFTDQELNTVKDSIITTYQCKIEYLPKIEVPEEHVTRIKSYRYRADSLLNLLDRTRPNEIDIMLGLTDIDIAITKLDKKTGKIKYPKSTYVDWAIFGLGRVNGHSCVVSKFRLKKGVNEKKYLKRLTRICNHEVGHVLGLRHCPTDECLMNDANETIRTIDKSTGKLCQSCLKKLD